MISWNDFQKIKIRVGTVIEVSDFPDAQKPSYKLRINFGPLGIKKTNSKFHV